MADEPDVNKKRPAHEVILRVLEQGSTRVQEIMHTAWRPGDATRDELLLIMTRAETLMLVLTMMVIPDKTRAEVVNRMEQLNWKALMFAHSIDLYGEVSRFINGLKADVPTDVT